MIYYFDTSALVKKYVLEAGTDRVVGLLKNGITAATSILAYPEMFSGIGRKKRDGDITERDYRSALTKFEADWAALFVIEFQNALLPVQKKLSAIHSLKGADLVHLSSLLWLREASREDVTLVASDVQLLKAAKSEEIDSINPEA